MQASIDVIAETTHVVGDQSIVDASSHRLLLDEALCDHVGVAELKRRVVAAIGAPWASRPHALALYVGDAELLDEWRGEDFGLQDGTTLTAVVRTETAPPPPPPPVAGPPMASSCATDPCRCNARSL